MLDGLEVDPKLGFLHGGSQGVDPGIIHQIDAILDRRRFGTCGGRHPVGCL
jgi:hypothetical protein